jgi:hypothetical protein
LRRLDDVDVVDDYVRFSSNDIGIGDKGPHSTYKTKLISENVVSGGKGIEATTLNLMQNSAHQSVPPTQLYSKKLKLDMGKRY